MKRGVRVIYVAGGMALLALAGCGRSFLQYGERASWRHEAEVTCLKSGAVKIGVGVVQMQPIEGPGMCGAEFPLKVALLGESGAAMGYGDDLRPPAGIPNASQPRWPASEPRYAPPQRCSKARCAGCRDRPASSGPRSARRHVTRRRASRTRFATPAGRPMSIYAPGVAVPDDIPDDAVLPPGRARAFVSAHPAGL